MAQEGPEWVYNRRLQATLMKIKRLLGIDKRGQRRHFQASNVVYIFLAILILGSIPFYLLRNNEKLSIKHAEASIKLEEVKEENAQIQDQNEALRVKLEFSSKQVTDDTTKELVRFYIRKYFPKDEWSIAEAISKCESGMNPKSLNEHNKNGTTDRGAWQLNTVHAKRFEQMYGIKWEIGAHDIDLSTQYAKFLWDHSSWGPWVCLGIIKK